MKNFINKLRYSLISRLILLFLVTAFLLVVMMRATMLFIMSNQFENNVLPHIFEYQHYLKQEIGSPPNVEKAAAIARRTGATIHIRGEIINWSSTDSEFDPDEIDFKDHRRYELQHGDSESVRYMLWEKDGHKIYAGFTRWVERSGEGIIPLLVLIFIVYLCYRGIRVLFRPIVDIRLGVQKMGEGELDHRILVKRKDELGELAVTVNTMAEDIEGMLDSKREMLLAISHELRSPLTRSRVSVALVDDDTIRENLNRDMKEMEELITELLESEKLNQRHAQLNRSPIMVNDLVTYLLDEMFPTDGIRTQLAADSVEVQLDEPRIRLLLKNLLTNAVRHHRPEQGDIIVSTATLNDSIEIRVVDQGIGIEPEHLPRITEPFYRPDPSRQRKTGGYGLGLYLCRMITEAHGGTLTIKSEVGRGTEVRATLNTVVTAKNH